MTLPYTDKKGLTEDPFFRDEQMQERASTENDRYFIVQAERGKDEGFEHFIDSRTQIFEDFILDSKLPTSRANRMIEYLTSIKTNLGFITNTRYLYKTRYTYQVNYKAKQKIRQTYILDYLRFSQDKVVIKRLILWLTNRMVYTR